MLSDIHRVRNESHWLWQASWLVLAIVPALAVWIWVHAASQWQAQEDETFSRHVSDVVAKLNNQNDHYLDILASFKAMFLVSNQVDRATFHQHYLELHAQDEYPALLAVQYAPWISHQEKAFLEHTVQQDQGIQPGAYPGYRVHPVGEREHYLPVVFNEPMTGNEAAFGLDQATGEVCQNVFEKARDSGQAQASAPLPLKQDPSSIGVVIRLPVYRVQTKIDTMQARREAYVGQISGIFRTADILKAAASNNEWTQSHWQVSDTTDATPAAVFDSKAHASGNWAPPAQANMADQRQHTVNLAGRQWSITVTRPHQFALLQPYPLALLFGGLVTALALWRGLRSAASKQRQVANLAMQLSNKARQNEAHLRSIMDNTMDGIVTISKSGIVLSANKAMTRIFGHTQQYMVGQHLRTLIPAAGQSASKHVDDFLLTQRVGMDGLGHRTEGRRSDGRGFPLDLSVSQMEVDDAFVFVVLLRDLSEQQCAELSVLEAQRQLNEVDEMRQVIVHNAPYAIFVLNPQGIIETVNPAGERLLGYKAQQLIGRSTTQRFFDPDQVEARAHMLSIRLNQPVNELNVLTHLAAESPGLPSEWNLIRLDGKVIVAEILVNTLTNEAGQLTGYLAMAQDVTLRRHAEDQLQHMAMHDALTALPNRNMLQEQLKTSLAQAEREGLNMGMMFLDLDRFKKINDTLGHHIGDNVLIEVARRLRSAMRTSDIVARLGGDEFVILLPRIAALDDGSKVAQKVLDLFTEPLRIGPHELRVTPSIGLALYPQHGADAITLMRHADLAMYQAKNTGRNRVQTYCDQMESPTADALVLENDLYKALERDELRLHFQPQFDCATGAITGTEALLRWEHGGKLVPPDEFIPLAEESGLIVAMGEWVLRRACQLGHAWRQRTGWPLRIAVNLSAVQLDRPDIVDVVAGALRDTGLEPTALELEITESVVVRESLRAADVLNQLRALGTSIAIDDFGVGYSSFAYLRELPVDRFKLDRSFLSAIPQSEGDSRLTAALIAMAHRLEVGIVAEGVETAEQAAFLKDHGCDECQGYYLGRPMPEAAFESLLVAHSQTHQQLIATLGRSDVTQT